MLTSVAEMHPLGSQGSGGGPLARRGGIQGRDTAKLQQWYDLQVPFSGFGLRLDFPAYAL